ncbi:hypothetical protein OYC64_013884 [Pagothenia borchgrevinki]|uniref:Uncharacterized protein n=1 Tax=Pagothenia borchgrevinki TaxID=8213 RepID=A0ABD2FW86_PAGBO
MRAAVFTILLLVIYQGEALKCNFCFSMESELCTPTGTQTCSRADDGCVAVTLTGALSSSYRQCMNMAACQSWVSVPGVFGICCNTDLCN